MSGIKYGLFSDPLLHHAALGNSYFETIVKNADGTSSFKTSDGHYVSQNPNEKGSFALASEIKAYEKFGLSGNLATSWTRPDQGDAIFTYVVVALPNAA